MADNSRIEDLRKRYHENPRRFFAPLANEYRKSGMLDRALQLCEKHVREQPENMNGLVVYGQTLFELQQTEAAREPFEQALKLDPENLIALRHLGDIARLLGDVSAAKGWYERVLELDRRNDEVLDLMAQLGGDAAPTEAPARPSTVAAGLISVAPTVSVSGGPDLGMIDLGEPAPAPAAPKPPAGKGATVVINAQALADRDRKDAERASSVTQPVAAVRPPEPVAEAAPPRPSKRASLLDIAFDFSETVEAEEPKAVPQAPVMGAEAAEYGFVDTDNTLIVETTGDVAPLGLEPTIAEAPSAPLPALPAADFELADYSGEVAPMAGLEATEFTTEQVAPMAELEVDSVSMSASSVTPLADLDRPDVTLDDVAPVTGLDTAMAVPAEEEPAGLSRLADLPLLEDPSATIPVEEQPSARPKPRMTKADLASLPLLADFGLEDEPASKSEPVAPAAVPASSMPTPVVPTPAVEAPSRASKATPTFVNETMAALYVQQGLLAEAIGVYQQLVEASPLDTSLRGKLAELERMHAQASQPASASRDEMPEFDAPDVEMEPTPAPANAAMADVSFGGIGLRGQGSATPIVTPIVAAGPTAREFFSGFARRAAVVAAAAAAPVAVAAAEPMPADDSSEPPTVASAAVSGWPLDALFGAASEVRDLHAAEIIAGLGTFTGPDGGTGIGELLSTTAAPKRAVPRASETLKFDQFFQKPGTAAAAAPEAGAAAPGDDDLDQFQDWLKGLKK
ncbi:hypothetical protein Strain138_001797 [Pseudogemmatithrix spongiicola]|uniref:Tetratricopeptide repeat protein n=1 Tax=Pseudogemmatithrix spongiicola TaxID=3062599 RepID=A0AA49K0L8_9BACT|nr:hypothetical protein Strain138_001797 [Gemmatimonadaceae bacterium 'strain 138']WKW15411.1 hypothetical protein Strain318_001796 [Gemmatimonadaceae bacterium 'strain 318']